MNNQVKKEASSNDSIESLNLTMQRMELNVLKVVGTLSERVNAMENKMDSLLLNINNLERNTSNTLATTVNGLATHLEKAHAANYEKQISHLAEVQTLSQIITALRQNPNAFGPVGGGIPLPVIQQQQPPQQQQQFPHLQQQQSTFRPVHPNLQAAPSIPQPPPQHVPMEPRPVAPAEPPKQFPVIKPNVAPEPSEKPSPFATNAGVFNFAQNQAQKPLFPTKPALPTAAATAGSPAQPTETKSIFGNTGKPFSFANAATPAPTSNPFAPASIQSQQPTPPVNQQKSLFTSPFANTGNTPISFTPATGNTAATPNMPSTPSAQQNEHEENENPEEYVPDAHYEPVIPLPDKVDVVTGEESEQVLFKNRCKLYIFNSETKEVKERGVGDLKVLYNPEKKSYRVVMRREQVHKICANFRITKGMNISDKTGTKGCGIFSCIDYSEHPQNGTSTVFYARFREENVYEEFKKLFKEIAEGNHVPSGIPSTNAGESTSSVTTSNLPKPTATVPKLPYIGDSNNPSVDVDEGEDEEDYDEYYGEENYDEESEVLLETDCKLTLGEAYKSPLSKNKNEEIHENVKLVVSVADEGVYKVEFDNGKDDPIFPHFIQNNTNYKKDGKNITFIARDHNAVRKSVKCEFKDAATAQKAFETLQECLESTDFQGDDDN